MLLFYGAILFEAAASDAAEPMQDPLEHPAPWPMILAVPPLGAPEDGPVALAPVPAADQALPQAEPLTAPPPGDPLLPVPPTAPPAAPLAIDAMIAALAGTPQPSAPPTPSGAPPPGSGSLDFSALLALLLLPVAEPPQHVGELPPPFLPPAPIAEEPWGLRDWSLL